MPKSALTVVLLLIATSWIFAQQQSGNQSTEAGSSQNTAMTIQGCLQESNGAFTLTDQSGTQYFLSGNTTELGRYANQEVAVRGIQSSPTVKSQGGFTTSNATSGTLPSFRVGSVSKISDMCQRGK